MTVSRAKGAKAKADRLFSELVRARGRCENCGERNHLQTAHIISRRYNWTRTCIGIDGIPANAFCLCAGCHRYYTDHPVLWGRFVDDVIGEDAHDALYERSQRRDKFDWTEELERLENL